MPAVAVPPSPNGLPTAITQSPTLGLAEFSKSTKGKPDPSTLITARSVASSRPMILAGSSRPSFKVILMSSAFSTTWLLVTM